MKWTGYIIRYKSSGLYNFSLVREDGKVINWRRNARFTTPEAAKAEAECCKEFDEEIEWKEEARG